MTNIRAWLYTHALDGESAEVTAQELAVYAEQTGMTVVGRSMDIGGEPLVTRMGIGSITQTAENGEFDVLLLQGSEQLSDDFAEAEQYMQLLRKHGVRVIAPTSGVITLSREV